jgi:hypothetical protein
MSVITSRLASFQSGGGHFSWQALVEHAAGAQFFHICLADSEPAEDQALCSPSFGGDIAHPHPSPILIGAQPGPRHHRRP